jgi:glycosyltransferase involved in cell wall biosynthesis
MRSSSSCAVASWAMADRYNELYACNAIPVIPSLDHSWSVAPAKSIHNRDTVIIGFAGQLYAEAEWLNLLLMFEKVNWIISKKKIILRVLGRSLHVTANSVHNIEFLGWHNQLETIRLLSETDMLYCPYWSNPVFHEEARYSFPSKLTTYLAAGRPVFFHGPAYASPARFLLEHDAAIFCHDLSPVNIYNCIERLIRDDELYERLASNGHKAFQTCLTIDIMRKQFEKFIRINTFAEERFLEKEGTKIHNENNLMVECNF